MENITLTINGTFIETIPGKTILEVVREQNLDNIPTLCDDTRLEHYTSCYLCVVEAEGIEKLIPSCSTKVSGGMKIQTNSKKVRESRKTALELLMSNHYADCIGPCTDNCPAGVDAQTYISLISHGDYTDALKLVKERNPLPLSICRVCVRDCELACRRNLIDEPVAVNSLKRFIADNDAKAMWAPEVKPGNGFRVAIVGSGPAGLTAAYYLTIEGYEVIIFEKYPEPGGMLRYGIPEYRLPKKILDEEIHWLQNLGVTIKTGTALGNDFSLQDLWDKGFQAIFLAVGAHKASKLGLAGEEGVAGIYRGIDFLRDVELGITPKLEGTVIVVGGGNTAIDAARTALRCGAEKVQIVYRRSIKEMPAHPEEIAAAQMEGVEILFLTNPQKLISEGDKVNGIECLIMRLEETKPGERPRPVPVAGSEFIVPCSFLISAIGQNVDTAFAQHEITLELAKWGTIMTNPETLETTIRGVFAGGDVVTGPFTAISAIAQGGKAAQAIMHFLTEGECKNPNQKFYSFKHKLAALSNNEFEKFSIQHRGHQSELTVEDRITGFQEVEKGFSEAEALLETGRCIECGCTEYADCRLRKYCDEYQINVEAVTGEVRKYKIDDRHPFIRLDPNKCINCGKCVRMCSEILGVSALGFVYRGFKSIVKPAMEKSLAETNCISCGNCIDVCPTGAIAEKFPFKLLGALEKENITTVCNFCSLGCLINIKKMANGIVYVANTTDEIAVSHNQGFLCAKGRFGHRYLLTKERVSNAAIKQNGQHVPYNIDEAIEYTAQKLKTIIEKYGTDSVAIMTSPKLSNEELYLLQKLARVGLQNNNIGSFSVNQSFAESIGNSASILSNISSLKMEDLHNADIIVILNANLSDDFLPLELQIKAIQKNGAKVVLFSSTETRLAKSADLWLDCKKGLSGFVLGCMMKRCIENANFDELNISNTVDNFPEFKEQICELDIEAMLKFAGLNREKFVAFTSMMQSTEANIAFICGLDSMPGTSVSSVNAIGNYLLLTGRANKANNGLLRLREFNNSAGLTTMGASSQFLPGSVTFNDVELTNKIGQKWDTNLADIFHPVDVSVKLKQGEIKALLVFGEDPLFDAQNEKYLRNIEFLLMSSPFTSVTMQNADVILPAAAFTEDDGTYTRFDNTLQNAPKIKQGPCELANWEVIQKLGTYFTSCMNYNSIAEVREEILLVTDLANASSEVTVNKNTKDRKTCSFALYDSNLSFSSAIKRSLHYQENYYFSHIKMQIS